MLPRTVVRVIVSPNLTLRPWSWTAEAATTDGQTKPIASPSLSRSVVACKSCRARPAARGARPACTTSRFVPMFSTLAKASRRAPFPTAVMTTTAATPSDIPTRERNVLSLWATRARREKAKLRASFIAGS